MRRSRVGSLLGAAMMCPLLCLLRMSLLFLQCMTRGCMLSVGVLGVALTRVTRLSVGRFLVLVSVGSEVAIQVRLASVMLL